MWDKISSLGGQFLSLFVSAACAGCGAESQKPICDRCLFRIQRAKNGGTRLSYGEYDGVFKELIHQFKYGNKFALAKPFAELLLEAAPKEIDCLIPVPLHIQKLRQRRYNPAVLIARHLCRLMSSPSSLSSQRKLGSIPLYVDVLKKISPSTSQTGLSKAERRRNVAKTFSVFKPNRIEGKRVLLIDDVYTTGATTDECGKELKKHGASKVTVLTLAHSE